MPKWMLLLLSSVARAPDGAEGGTPAAAEPAPAGGEASPDGGTPPAADEGNGSLIPEGGEPEAPAEGDAAKPEPAPPAEPIDLTKLQLPEGMKADDPALAKLVETLSDPKLSPAQRTEALLGQHTDLLRSVGEAAQKQLTDNYATLNKSWVDEVRADPNIGGANFDRTISTVAKAIDTWSPDAKAMRQALALTGAGNNPHVIRTFYAMAVALGEGRPAQGSAAAPAKTAVDILYGGSAPSNQ